MPFTEDVGYWDANTFRGAGNLDGRIRRRKMDPRYSWANFRYGDPVVAQKIASGGTEGSSGGGAATGSTGDENRMVFGGEYFEYFIKGTQTLFMPVMGATGLGVQMDLTASDGWELHTGRGAHSRNIFTVGTDAAFFVEATFIPSDVSGANPLVIGFRKQGANNATYTSYSDYACVGIVGTAAKLQTDTNIGSAGHVLTDTTQVALDATSITLRVDVSAAGVVTYKINGAAPTTVVAYTFANALALQPYATFVQAADVCDTLEIIQWECGLL